VEYVICFAQESERETALHISNARDVLRKTTTHLSQFQKGPLVIAWNAIVQKSAQDQFDLVFVTNGDDMEVPGRLVRIFCNDSTRCT
jgi:hypothetical protein